jgi:transcriptional regulator GlxA family with amidase domain
MSGESSRTATAPAPRPGTVRPQEAHLNPSGAATDADRDGADTPEVRNLPDNPGEGSALNLADTQHPQVRRAIALIERRANEPQLNVAAIATELGMNATYLAHLFREETGVRMSRLIAWHRIEIAKTLLSTTDWQVKRIAYESGHGNPNWFSHVFRLHTGDSPSEYRDRVAKQSRA